MQKVTRIAKILNMLQKKGMTSKELAKSFNVHQRTIQRDLKTLRKSGVPLNKDKNGRYILNKNIIKYKDFSFDESELSFIVGLKDLLSKMGKPFNTAARNLLNLVSYDSLESISFSL